MGRKKTCSLQSVKIDKHDALTLHFFYFLKKLYVTIHKKRTTRKM
jgi:hypothetical protein